MIFRFYARCVEWPEDAHLVGGLCSMIDSELSITRATFKRYVDLDQLRQMESDLGYIRKLPMGNDWHVTYHRSKLHGKRVYYFRHSAIEYVFTQQARNP